MKVLVYDTETTGLPKKGITQPPCIKEESFYPHIVQLSYIIYDTSSNEVLKVYDNVVKIPDYIEISKESINLHHITREIMDEKGIHIVDALKEFIVDFAQVDVVAGHNISFDNKMVLIEMVRNSDVFVVEEIDRFRNFGKFYCTMMNSIDLCAIKTCYRNSTKTYNKFPKLIELYTYLFQSTPTKLHNSLNDVVLCLRCFCKMVDGDGDGKDISLLNPMVRQMINDTM